MTVSYTHLKHEVLNAKNHEREAEIVAQAGKKGAVTIATNMDDGGRNRHDDRDAIYQEFRSALYGDFRQRFLAQMAYDTGKLVQGLCLYSYEMCIRDRC